MGDLMKDGNRKNKELINDKIAIFNFLKRVTITAIFLISIIVLYVYFFIYIQMSQELKSSLLDKFVESGNINYYLIKSSIQRAEEGANSLSSRTMIRAAIEEYLDGDISLEELKIYTKDKYIDGAKALDNIIYAERIVEEGSIAKYDISNFSIPEFNLNKINSLDAISIEFDIHQSVALIYSPIKTDRGIIGYDYIIYMIKDQLDLLCTAEMMVDLIDDCGCNNILEYSKVLKSEGDMMLLETPIDFYVLYEIGDVKLYTKENKSNLLKPLTRVINHIIIASIVLFIIINIAIYIFIIRYAHDEIKGLDESRKEFKRIAYLDQLTGAYSRRFLEVWNKSYRKDDENYSLVMIDVDDFKKINDVFGHAVGDLVLKGIAECIMKNSRETDIVVRFGGDEFLLILPCSSIDEAKKLMVRVEKHIASIEGISVPIFISYGISSFTKEEAYEKAIKEADELMYKNKIGKKETKNI